jgi:hypothetical protein
MRRRTSLAMAGLIVTATALGADGGPVRPSLAFAGEVPADVRALASSTWDRFTAAFSSRQACLAPAVVATAWSLDDRGGYDPDGRMITLRIPGTAPNLSATLIHEFAHHLEFSCPALRSLRPSFLAAQGLDPHTPWRAGATWSEIPSEQFAEATVRFVLGRAPAHHLVSIADEAVAVIRAWAERSRLIHRRATP